MKSKSIQILSLLCLTSLIACSQIAAENDKVDVATDKVSIHPQEPHQYGGWYCPDNLNGFPAVDIKDWKNVPVVNGRMPTEEETRNGTSLILVDTEKYPDAKPLDMEMPKLARFYNHSTNKSEIVIVIQAVNVADDSVVGFRYLNGGNGSARIHEVNFLSEAEIEQLTPSRFVAFDLNIDATQAEIWEVLTNPDFSQALQPLFDTENALDVDWAQSAQVNFNYPKSGDPTAEYAGNLFGNQYAQLDYESKNNQYVEKFLLLNNEETKQTELKVVCGPYQADFETQQAIIKAWSQKVKELSEAL